MAADWSIGRFIRGSAICDSWLFLAVVSCSGPMVGGGWTEETWAVRWPVRWPVAVRDMGGYGASVGGGPPTVSGRCAG